MIRERVLLVVDSAAMGGIETHILQLSRALTSKQVRVTVVFLCDHSATRGAHPLHEQLALSGLNYLCLDGRTSSFVKVIKSIKPTVIHSHGYKAGLFSRLAKIMNNFKLVHTYHAGEKAKGKLALYTFIDRMSSFLNDENIVVSDLIAESIPARSKLVNNFIDTSTITYSFEEKTNQEIAFVGRLSDEKCPSDFIEIAKHFSDQKFAIYGDGPLKDSIETKATKNIQLYGHVNMSEHWHKVKILIICSEFEGLPLVLLEAMARGVIVISYTLGQIPKVIENSNNGFLIAGRNRYEMIKQLSTALNLSKSKLQSIRNEAINTVSNSYSTKAVLPQYLKIYFGDKKHQEDSAQTDITTLFVHYGDNWIRGSEKCLINLVRDSRTYGVRPIVWTNSRALFAELEKIGVSCKLDTFNVLLGWEAPRFSILSFFKQVWQGIKLIKTHKVDVIHTNGGAPNQWMVFSSKLCGKPILTQLHAPYQLRDRISLNLSSPDKVIGVSRAVLSPFFSDTHKHSSSSKTLDKFSVIHNGIDLAPFERAQSKIERTNIRQELIISKNNFVLVSVGSLIERKGMDLIIRAVKIVKERGIPVSLIIIGDGRERKALEKLIEELDLQNIVHLLGEREDVASILCSNVDLYVSGARSEAFGLVFAEAGAAGLASVAPDVDGIPEVLIDKHTGMLVKKGSIGDLANSISQLYENPSLREKLAARAQERVKDNFDVKQNTRRFCEQYKKLAGATKNSIPREITLSLTTPFVDLFNAYKARGTEK